MAGRRRVRLATGIVASYLTSGAEAGTPLVLLHAWVESARCFDRLLPLLPSTVRAYAADQRGHGETDKPPHGYTLAELAADVIAFLDVLNVPRATLLGSSSGGYVAQQVAVAHADRVEGLILVGSPRSLNRRPPFADEVDRLTDPVDRAFVEASLLWYPVYTDVPGWYLRDRVDDAVRVPAEIWRRSLAGLVEAVPPIEIGAVAAPTLVIRGGRDELISRADTEAMTAAISNASLTVYEEAGHVVLWERPDRIAADVAAFLARPGPSSRRGRPC